MPIVLPRQVERHDLHAAIPFYVTVEREQGLFCYLRFHHLDGRQFLPTSDDDLVVLDRTFGGTTVPPSEPQDGQNIQPYYLLVKSHAYLATYRGQRCFTYGDH